ncbi:aldo/keto reductase [Prevotella sp. KH2C16]|uniref:aldo/keto reductase n=1 Tax=Prevotella sp. KH2C16 TaxID=1855325 RepID=UPI0008E08E68|nr:aldo/keto reductase [Prevotella sp. KH2C16]SFG37026.1 Predicted oxidoreductase [Prevotella sp. KH2C16]
MKRNNITLGTWSWGTGAAGGDQVFGNHTDAAQLKPVFDAAMHEGLNRWDTATVYGMGASEDILGSFARGVKRSEIELSTKFTPQIAEMYGNSVEKMAEASLKRLGTDYIDIYWIHNPMDVERWTPGLLPLLKSGMVRRVGVSNHNIDEIRRADAILQAEGFRISAVQNHFSLLYRSSERGGVLDYCKEQGIEFWSYMVLEQGALSGRYSTESPLPAESARGQKYNPVLDKIERLTAALSEIGRSYGISASQTAIAWAVAKGTMPIIGATKEKHVVEAAKAQSIKLSKDEIEQLELLADQAGVDTRGDWEHGME